MRVLKTSPALLLCFLAACGTDVGEVEDPSSGGGTDVPGGSGQDPGCDVPIVGLQAYLIQGTYKQFAAEPEIHASAGPHFGDVRTYLNPLLDASLKSGAGEHPQCAASVKELYFSGTTVRGWAVSVKTSTRSSSGTGWYWYEVTSTNPDARATAGQGIPLCTGCHSDGEDYILTRPLR